MAYIVTMESLPCCVGSAWQLKGSSEEAGVFLAVFSDIGKLLGCEGLVE